MGCGCMVCVGRVVLGYHGGIMGERSVGVCGLEWKWGRVGVWGG